MMRIGSLTLPHGAMLAPMAGVTDLPFRLLCREMGCALSVTEMVSAKGYLRAPENQQAIQSLLARAPQEGPLCVQLFGQDPGDMGEAAARLEASGFAAIDLNMGCPAPKITGGGAGSALLRDLPRAAAIIRAVRQAVSLPLTVKMRLGWDAGDFVAEALARIAEAEGADAVIVHGRTRSQGYAGVADWAAIARVKQSVHIPVIGNGDIFTAVDALQRAEESGCDGVMIGRGALGNPWIFRQVLDALDGRPVTLPDAAARAAMAMRHARMLAAWKGEGVAIREMRKHGAWYTKGLTGAVKAREAVHRAQTLADLAGAMEALCEAELWAKEL